jgi:hypothetical protein
LEDQLSRNEDSLAREQEKEDLSSEMNDARGQESFFMDVIEYYEAKLNWYDALEAAMNPDDPGDMAFLDTHQPEKERLWNMLDSLYEQLGFVQSHLEDLDFRNFSMETRFAKEDQAAAKADEDRQFGWLEEVQGDISAIEAEMEELKDADGNVGADNT